MRTWTSGTSCTGRGRTRTGTTCGGVPLDGREEGLRRGWKHVQHGVVGDRCVVRDVPRAGVGTREMGQERGEGRRGEHGAGGSAEGAARGGVEVRSDDGRGQARCAADGSFGDRDVCRAATRGGGRSARRTHPGSRWPRRTGWRCSSRLCTSPTGRSRMRCTSTGRSCRARCTRRG